MDLNTLELQWCTLLHCIAIMCDLETLLIRATGTRSAGIFALHKLIWYKRYELSIIPNPTSTQWWSYDTERHSSIRTYSVDSVKKSFSLVWLCSHPTRFATSLLFIKLTWHCNRYILIHASTLTNYYDETLSMQRADRSYSLTGIRSNRTYKPVGVWKGKYLLITHLLIAAILYAFSHYIGRTGANIDPRYARFFPSV